MSKQNIVVSVNKKYIEPLRTLLYSLRRNDKADISVWFLNSSLNDEEIEELRKFVIKLGMSFIKVDIDYPEINQLPIVDENLFSIETYYRLLIPWVLPKEIERALWLDADIIIRQDITSFYNTDFKDKCLVACPDDRQFNDEVRRQDGERLDLQDLHCYFNAGVLLMNLLEIRKRTTMNNVILLAKRLDKKLLYQDQDVLNCIAQVDVIYLDRINYNCSLSVYNSLDKELRGQVAILHYYCPIKPWHRKRFTDADIQYWNIRRLMGYIVISPYIFNFMWKCLRHNKVLKRLYIKLIERM